MKRRMESRKATRGGAGAQEENGHAIRLFSTGEQFLTRSCARCAGLLVNEWCYDLDYAGVQQPEFLRCVQCGHRVDAVIVQNQMRSPVAKHHMRRVQPALSVDTKMRNTVA